jgi:CRISPR-associated endonuclease/helicase Cas3
MLQKKSVLAVVNTKRDARAVFQRICAAEGAFHLSTSLCGAHRSEVLGQVKKRLAKGRLCRLVSTQLIEAVVDVDFAAVARAAAPLVSIVQAAGRCNREGKRHTGEVLVFNPAEGGMPPGPYRTGTDTTLAMLRAAPGLDFDDPGVHKRYFERLYQGVELDKSRIQQLRKRFKFARVGQVFRMIDQDTTPVLVTWGDMDSEVAAIRRERPLSSEIMRRLQPYFVTLYEHEFEVACSKGFCEELDAGLWVWNGLYDPELGLQLDSPEMGLLPV